MFKKIAAGVTGGVVLGSAAFTNAADVVTTYVFDPLNPGESAVGLVTAAAPGVNIALGTWLTILPVVIFLVVGGYMLAKMKGLIGSAKK